jgi:hypothetical protein
MLAATPGVRETEEIAYAPEASFFFFKDTSWREASSLNLF